VQKQLFVTVSKKKAPIRRQPTRLQKYIEKHSPTKKELKRPMKRLSTQRISIQSIKLKRSQLMSIQRKVKRNRKLKISDKEATYGAKKRLGLLKGWNDLTNEPIYQEIEK
jgi:hypothetical protein